MSTNFYLPGEREDCFDTEFHIGKRCNAGGETMRFIWAMHPEKAVQLIHQEKGAVDEYGRLLTPQEFADEVIKACRIHDDSSIGEEFV
jgi:hypothetical protein